MAFVNLEKQLFENTTVMLKPRVTVISSSVGGGSTGSAHIYPVRSERVRNTYDLSFVAQLYNQDNQNAYNEAAGNTQFIANFENYLNTYGVDSIFNIIDSLESAVPKGVIQNKTIPICRFDSPTFFNKEHTIINNIVKTLQPHHQHRYPNSGLHYGNYHTLNFFTGSGVPDDSCLIYPNVHGVYHPTSSFSLDFWINPRYDNQVAGAEYHAGTIFHMSSSIALSLVSGSQTDEFGKVSSFKLLLQLSQSADFNPRTVDLSNPSNSGTYPRDLIFTSSQELSKNHWHHVCVRWGGQNVNNYSGSIVIDDNSTSFYIPSASLHTNQFNPLLASTTDTDLVVIGNFFDSDKSAGRSLFSSKSTSGAVFQGGLYSRTNGVDEPTPAEQELMFSNKLNAEIHDIKFFKKYLNNQEVEYLRYNGISNQLILNEFGENVSGETNLYDDLLFYVPVFFFPYREHTRFFKMLTHVYNNTNPGALGYGSTAYRQSRGHIAGRTFHPYNVDLSHRTGNREINLENFVREFKQASKNSGPASSYINRYGNDLDKIGYPRLQSLSSSIISGLTETTPLLDYGAKYSLYSRPEHRARNLTILPNDNGQFKPNYYPITREFDDYLSVESSNQEMISNLKDCYFEKSFDLISLENLVYKDSSKYGTTSNPSLSKEWQYGRGLMYPSPFSTEEITIGTNSDGRFYNVSNGSDGLSFYEGVGPTPEKPQNQLTGQEVSQYHSTPSRLRTTYSNEMTIFDISNLYYGNRIAPGSFEIFDNSVTGSNGVVKIRLKDNEHGSLYRADCLTKQATWNNIGDIYYDEGLVLIKSPHMSYYCKDRTEISLTGEQNLHTLIMNIPVETGLVNSSSNATFKSIPPSENINDADKETVYITGVNIHDNNFNIIMKAQFAQPIIKADDDEFIIRLKQDF